MPVKNRFAELLPEIKAWRHDLHAHPEILFETHRTSAIVAEKLKANAEAIVGELHAARGTAVDTGGYYNPDPEKLAVVMRPSQTLNQIIG